MISIPLEAPEQVTSWILSYAGWNHHTIVVLPILRYRGNEDTVPLAGSDVRFGSKADITPLDFDVCLLPKADIACAFMSTRTSAVHVIFGNVRKRATVIWREADHVGLSLLPSS